MSKEFYHTQAGMHCSSPEINLSSKANSTFSIANLEVKTKAPNGVNFLVKGKSPHEGGDLTGSVSWVYAATGNDTKALIGSLRQHCSSRPRSKIKPTVHFFRSFRNNISTPPRSTIRRRNLFPLIQTTRRSSLLVFVQNTSFLLCRDGLRHMGLLLFTH